MKSFEVPVIRLHFELGHWCVKQDGADHTMSISLARQYSAYALAVAKALTEASDAAEMLNKAAGIEDEMEALLGAVLKVTDRT